MAMKRGYQDMLREAESQIRRLSPSDAVARTNDPNVVFVDVRDPRELDREGMVPGAVSAPRGMLEFWVDPASPYHKPVFAQDKTYILYCAAGWRSALATKLLQDMGIADVMDIDGGFGGWRAVGGPVHTREPKAAAPAAAAVAPPKPAKKAVKAKGKPKARVKAKTKTKTKVKTKAKAKVAAKARTKPKAKKKR